MITLQSNIKAASRKEAFTLIENLMRDKDQVSGIGNDDIERLYRYFLPAIPKKAKTPAQWISKATSQKDVRPFAQYIHVTDNGKLVASDGHRLHFTTIYDAGEFESGNYDPKSLKSVTTDFKYPDIDRVIPLYRQDGFITVDVEQCEQKVIRSCGQDVVSIKVLDNWIQLNYLMDATNGAASFKAQQPDGENKAYVFDMPEFNGTAIVMPIAA